MVNAVPFAELCKRDGLPTQKIIDDTHEFLGYISYNRHDGLLGKGTFKTAKLASLSWVSTQPTRGLGALTSGIIQIALKRPYDDSHTGQDIKRFNFADEIRKVLTEGTLLGWADSLLQFAYDFIDNFLAHQAPSDDPCQIIIPRLRFVKAAVAYSIKPVDKASGTSSSVSRRRIAYLLEELIPTELPFIKYIHNAEAVPLQDAGEEGYETAVFLCFIQHVQFIITQGQAYISDFQGALYYLLKAKFPTLFAFKGTGDLLTDPQVMTHP